MIDLENSFELLSTMSPKFKGAKSGKKLKKSPHKLGLKSNIRRSAAFDKAPHSHHVRDSSIIILEDSGLTDKLSPTKVKVIKAPIIISSTSESENSDCKEDVKPYINVQPKYIDIDTWLSDNEKLDGYSEIFSFKHNSFSESDDEKINISVKKTSTEENQASGTWQVLEIESKEGKEILRTPVPAKELYKLQSLNSSTEDLGMNNSDVDIIEDSENERNTYAESLLDDLYGTSWRANKDLVLTRSEPRKQKKHSSVQMPKTERKPRTTSRKLEPKALWAQRLKEICDSDSELSTSADSCKSTGNFSDSGRKLCFSDSEDESDINYRMTPPINVGKTNTKKTKKYTSKSSLNTSRSSNEINFSESDNDSLGTKVRKKLAKKAKSLTNKSKKKSPINKTETIKNSSNNSCKLETTTLKTTKYNVNSEKYSFLKSLSGGIPPWKSHPEAQNFKTNFKTEKVKLAKTLFNLYNEKIFGNALPENTSIEWNDRMRGTAGFCYNSKITRRDGTVTRSCRIALSTKVLDTADRLRDTLVHEMCHAATWLVNNVADGHGSYWKSWSYKAMKVFPELPTIKRCHDYQINTKYTYKCIDCGYSIGRHSKSLDIERKRCGYCYGKFEVFINKVTKDGVRQQTPIKGKNPPTAFALYVKENYSLVKRDNLKHAEVMKILGQKFAELKVNQKI